MYSRRACPACKAFIDYVKEHYPQITLYVIMLEDIDGDPEYLSEWLARVGMIQNKVPAIAFDKTPTTRSSAQALKEIERRLGSSASQTTGAEACTTAGCSV